MKRVAIIGPTASGKSALALELAQEYNAYIFSIDSLAIYKYFDIVSAKPSKEELRLVQHFGIDAIEPQEHFNVERLLHIYQQAKTKAQQDRKNLIIVGGSSFYLKTLFQGLSPLPPISAQIQSKVQRELQELPKAYEKLRRIDPVFAQKITPKDRYRIEKALLIYYATSLAPTRYFLEHPPIAIDRMPLFEIEIDKEELRKRIWLRTKQMIASGLIDEIAALEKRYTRAIQPMKAIGVKETLDFLDGKFSKDTLLNQIATHTAQLAKRQRTFNRTQFPKKRSLPLKALKEAIKKELAD